MIPESDLQDFCANDPKPEIVEDESANEKLHKRFLVAGLMQEVAEKLTEATRNGIFEESEFDDRTIESIKEAGETTLTCLPDLIKHPALSALKSRVPYLLGMISTLKVRLNPPPAPVAVQSQLRGPDNLRIEELKARLGMPLEITSGQRHLGPSPDWNGPPPTNEIFIGHLPYDVFEDELIPIFEVFGNIYDARIMLDPSGQFCPPPGHKGFAFINYVERHSAEEAIKAMNGFEIHGKKVKVNSSYQNTRLFVGNLPKNKSRDEILEEITKVTEGCADVIIYADINDSRVKNRGFCFVDYDCHKNASAARRRFTSGQALVFGRTVVADWADPIQQPDEEVMSKVKVLYVKNLKEEVTEEQLHQKFAEFGALEKCKKIKDYAFVTFRDRPAALQALESLHGYLMAGIPLDVTLARPQSEELKKKKEERRGQFDPTKAPAPYYGGAAPGAMQYGYGVGGWDPMSMQPRMPSHRGSFPGAGRGFRGRGDGMRGRAPRGGAPMRGGRGGYPRPPRGGPPVGAHYANQPAPLPPPPLAQGWGGSNGAAYHGYTGGYATVPGGAPAVDYSQAYEGYEYAPVPPSAPPPPPPPPPPPEDYNSYAASYGYHTEAGVMPGYVPPTMAPVHSYGGNGTYAPPKTYPPRGTAARGRGANPVRGAAGGQGAVANAARGMKRPNQSTTVQGNGRGSWGGQAPKNPKMMQGSAPMYTSSNSAGLAQSQGYDASAYAAAYGMDPYADPNVAVAQNTVGGENQNGQQQQQQQWYSNNFSEGWQ